MKTGITVVGLGPGSAGHLSVETLDVLKNARRLFCVRQYHPASASWNVPG